MTEEFGMHTAQDSSIIEFGQGRRIEGLALFYDALKEKKVEFLLFRAS